MLKDIYNIVCSSLGDKEEESKKSDHISKCFLKLRLNLNL